LSFFFQRQSGKPYGYTFDAPRTSFGDTFGGNEPIDDDDTQLLYVPTGPDDPNVIFASASTSTRSNRCLTVNHALASSAAK